MVWSLLSRLAQQPKSNPLPALLTCYRFVLNVPVPGLDSSTCLVLTQHSYTTTTAAHRPTQLHNASSLSRSETLQMSKSFLSLCLLPAFLLLPASLKMSSPLSGGNTSLGRLTARQDGSLSSFPFHSPLQEELLLL